MSEQSGGGPITREQVERAIERSQVADQRGINDALGYPWYAQAPGDVRYAWDFRHARCWTPLTAALTRWRDELTAAEPVRRVARWDAELEAYALTPIHDDGALMTHAVEDAAKARDWGYEIEGGPERLAEEERLACAYRESDGTLVWDDSPLPEPAEDSPERLRERRERLGWTTAYAGHWVPWFDHTDVERAESGRGITAFVARYAAALSAEEERRGAQLLADEEARAEAFHAEPDHLAYADSPVWDDGPLPTPTPERPAPRFKVVDVPQPRIVVKRCDEVEAEWTSADATILIVTHDALDDAIFVPIALLRAMLADIDAQQGGAS